MKLIIKTKTTFDDVPLHRFFLWEDYVCQKHSSKIFVVIAQKDGNPYSEVCQVIDGTMEHVELLPISKIVLD